MRGSLTFHRNTPGNIGAPRACLRKHSDHVGARSAVLGILVVRNALPG